MYFKFYTPPPRPYLNQTVPHIKEKQSVLYHLGRKIRIQK